MQQILHHYQLRLTNLSQANRSLKLSRLSSRRDLDLCQLDALAGHSREALLQRLIAGKDVRLIDQLDPRFERNNLADRRLNRIFRSVESLEAETGTYDLRLGYPFVEGTFIDGTPVRCPVLLFPVRLHRSLHSKPRWSLVYLENEPISFNRTFFLAYEQFQQVRLPASFWEEEVEPQSDWTAWLDALYQQLKPYELALNFNPRLFDGELQPFPDYTKAELDRWRKGVLTFRSQAVLGLFPQSDSALLQDYQVLNEQPEAFPLAAYFDETATEAAPPPSRPAYVREEDRYFATPVDQSQEEALLKVKAGRSLVVYGPPGTGKSQVIVNLIADAMAHGKKVLLVSQKRAALDVVYKRLKALGLARFSVLLHDYRQDRSAIFQQIRQLIDDLDRFQQEQRDLNLTKWEHDYKRLSREADQLARQYEALGQALTEPLPCGLTPHELYLRSDASQSPLPLEAVAKNLDESGLESLLRKLRMVTDYAPFFASGYPWRDRHSFRHYSYEDRERLQAKLDALPGQLQQLHRSYAQLSDQLSTRITELSLNRQRIAELREVERRVADHATREGMEALHRDRLTPEAVEEELGRFSLALDRLDQRRYLDDEHWQLLDSLEKHSRVYREQHERTLRWLSVAFLRARWFLGKLLERHGQKLSPETFGQVEREVKAMARLRQRYAQVHEQAFFEDFPLLGTQAEKRRWVDQKADYLQAYRATTAIRYFPKIKPRFRHDQFDGQHWQQSLQAVAALEAFTQAQEDAVRDWQTYLSPAQAEVLVEGIRDPAAPLHYVAQLRESFARDFLDLQSLDSQLAGFSPVERRALDGLQDQLPEEAAAVSDWLAQVRQSVYAHWLAQAERARPELALVSTRGWQRQREEFARMLGERQGHVGELVQRRVQEHILSQLEFNRLGNPVTYRSIRHQVGKKRRLWPVRKLVRETWAELGALTPCWLASPEAVAAVFPMQADLFDLVIFDEASQCFVERGLPVLLRGRQCVVAGDDKQLRPSDLYQVRYEEAEEELLENELALESESILDLARHTFEATRLDWHYRSAEEALINFSNHAFYEGRLKLMAPARPEAAFQPPFRWVSVEGLWQDSRNLPEAQRVVELVLAYVQSPTQPSLGIVTFNYHQQELIKDLLEEKLEALGQGDSELYDRLQACMHRQEEEEFQGLFVKNIENVQGDERDVIIFSIGYAPNEAGKLLARFGLLNQKGGENRLNVAITRARKQVCIVCSFQPAQLPVATVANEGPRYLQQYLHYAQAISEGRPQAAQPYLAALPETAPLRSAPLNPIAAWLAPRLREAGYHVLENFGDTAFKLDLAIKARPEDPAFLLGISCEGSHYFSGQSAKEREVYRPRLLQSRGWQLYHVWARNFWQNREKEWEKIRGVLAASG